MDRRPDSVARGRRTPRGATWNWGIYRWLAYAAVAVLVIAALWRVPVTSPDNPHDELGAIEEFLNYVMAAGVLAVAVTVGGVIEAVLARRRRRPENG